MSPHIGLNAHLLSAETAGYRRAGIHSYIANLLAHLPDVDRDYCYTALVGPGVPSPHSALRLQHSRWPTENPARRIIWEQLAQPWQLNNYDLVHELVFVAPLIMPRPFVVTVYDLTFMRYPDRLPPVRRVYLRLFTAISCRRARRVIAISQSTADDLVTLLGIPRTKIDLAIPGVDPRFVPLPPGDVAEWRRQKGLPERFLLYLGTLEPRKNLPILLKAYAALPPADRKAVPLVLAGGRGWMVEEIDQTIEQYGLHDTIHRPGYVPDSELPWWYNAADALVYPSVFEGWGMPVTEAMACGKPALVSDISSLPDAVGDTGLCLPPGDVEAWTMALDRCIHDARWRDEQGVLARDRARGFTWQQTALQTVASYRRALETHSDA